MSPVESWAFVVSLAFNLAAQTAPPGKDELHYRFQAERAIEKAAPTFRVGRRGLYRGSIVGVYHAISSFVDARGICWPSYRAISLRSGKDRSTVIRAVKWLEAHGWLVVIRRHLADRDNPTRSWQGERRRSNIYVVLLQPLDELLNGSADDVLEEAPLDDVDLQDFDEEEAPPSGPIVAPPAPAPPPAPPAAPPPAPAPPADEVRQLAAPLEQLAAVTDGNRSIDATALLTIWKGMGLDVGRAVATAQDVLREARTMTLSGRRMTLEQVLDKCSRFGNAAAMRLREQGGAPAGPPVDVLAEYARAERREADRYAAEQEAAKTWHARAPATGLATPPSAFLPKRRAPP